MTLIENTYTDESSESGALLDSYGGTVVEEHLNGNPQTFEEVVAIPVWNERGPSDDPNISQFVSYGMELPGGPEEKRLDVLRGHTTDLEEAQVDPIVKVIFHDQELGESYSIHGIATY